MALLAASLAIGILSHIAWDAFTHEGRAGTALVPALSEQWGPMIGVKWLQHGSSLLGLAILITWGCLWLARARPRPISRVVPTWVRVAWWLSLPIILAAAGLMGLAMLGPLDEDLTAAHLAYRVLPPACAIWGVATLGLALAVLLARAAETRGKRARHARDAS